MKSRWKLILKAMKVPINDGNETPFGIIDMPVGRYHMFLATYEKTDSGHLRVTFANKRFFKPAEQLKRMNMLADERLILPVPFVGHWVNDVQYMEQRKFCNAKRPLCFRLEIYVFNLQ